MKSKKILAALSLSALLQCGFAVSARGALFTTNSPEEAMVFSGSPNTVWDPKGATEISSNGLNTGYGSSNVEYSLTVFNGSSIVSQLNSAYGVNGWTITGVALTLASNFGTANVYPNNNVFNEIEPGHFTMNWISNNGWTGDQVTWNNLNNYLPASSSSNLRQWAVALNVYVDQNHGWLPRRGDGIVGVQNVTRYYDWFNALPPLMNQSTYQSLTSVGRMPQVTQNSVWICPQLTGFANSNGYLFGYAMNMALSVEIATYPDRITRIGSASTMVFMTDGPAGWCSTVPYIATSSAPALFNPVPRHDGQVNIAFVDGHVSAYPGSSIGVGAEGTLAQPNGCDTSEVRWYWYNPTVTGAPWGGP